MSTKDRINKVIKDQLGLHPVTLNESTRIKEDLGADSLDSVEIVLALEDEFQIHVEDTELENLTTMKLIYDYVESKYRR